MPVTCAVVPVLYKNQKINSPSPAFLLSHNGDSGDPTGVFVSQAQRAQPFSRRRGSLHRQLLLEPSNPGAQGYHQTGLDPKLNPCLLEKTHRLDTARLHHLQAFGHLVC